MKGIEFVKDYKHNPELRASFNKRLREIFNFDMEKLYDGGYWSDIYIPYSFVAGSEIVSNVSAISQDFIVGGVHRKGVVIESVLTVPEFRGLGLADKLMRTVIREYEAADFICLYSVPEALEFYPRFGFYELPEYRCVIKNIFVADSGLHSRKLNLSAPEDFDTLAYFLNNSVPVSRKFSVTGDKAFLMYELVNSAGDSLWHLDGADAIAVAAERDGALHINHVLSLSPPETGDIIKYFPSAVPRDIVLGYTPDTPGAYALEFEPMTGPGFFIRGENNFPERFMMPFYSRS